jgi:hypothetical protein
MPPLFSRSSCFSFVPRLACVAALLPGAALAGDLWLAVGYGGRRMVSSDGRQWEITAEWAQPGADDKHNLMSAVHAQGKFVVAGGGGAGASGGGHVLVSKDGREWRHTLQDKSRIHPVVFGSDRFVVGTSSYPSGKLMWSSDAEEWTEGGEIEKKGLTHFRGGAYGNGLFVLVGNGSAKDAEGKNVPFHWAIATPDGERIVSERTDLPGHGKIVFGAGHFLMLTRHADAALIRSKDGADWAEVRLPEPAKLSWLVWTGGEFLAGDHRQAFRSRDGLEWENAAIKARSGIVWSDGTRFIATGWPGRMAFSPDGHSWEKGSDLTDNGINVVVHAPAR